MNEQIASILIKAQASLEAADLLYSNGYYDFSVSRAYYAMFYTAEALLLQRGLSYSSHSAVIAAYGKEFSKTLELDPKFHKYLIGVQDYRNLGDYGFGVDVTAEQTKNAIAWAKEFQEAASNYLARLDH
jgi:uncharacterized protein (UPF0332 family)